MTTQLVQIRHLSRNKSFHSCSTEHLTRSEKVFQVMFQLHLAWLKRELTMTKGVALYHLYIGTTVYATKRKGREVNAACLLRIFNLGLTVFP